MAETTTSTSTPQSGGSNMGLYIGLGVFTLLALGGGGYYFYAQQKKKEAEDKAKAEAAAAAAAEVAAQNASSVKVPIQGKDGKPVTDKEGKAILVPATSIQAGQPIIGTDGKPILDRSGQPVIPSATDVKAATVEAKIAEKKATIAKGITNDWVKGSEVDKRNANPDFKPYSETVSGDLRGKIVEVFDLRPDYKKEWIKHPKLYPKKRKKAEADMNNLVSQIEGYARGYLKGMNLALRADYIGTFGQEIKEYFNNPSKLNEGSVEKAGQFLKVAE